MGINTYKSDLKGIPVQEFYKMNNLEKATIEQKISAFKELGFTHTAHVQTGEANLRIYEITYGYFTDTI